MNATRGSKNPAGLRPLAARLSGILLFVLAGYLVADVGTLWARRFMLPTQPPPSKPKKPHSFGPQGNYQSVVTRNMFNSDGVIGEPLIAKKRGEGHEELPPIPSQLPLTLIGTLVHSNPELSLAAIEVRGKNQIVSFRPKQQIESLATLEKVERMKIFLRNMNSGRLEYLEMKNAPKMSLKGGTKPAQQGDVKKVSETEFEIKRADLLKHTSDLSSILMQARVVPARRGGSGEIYGYRVVEMQPNSIYTQLGLQVMDVITGVNGTPVTNPQQAMELYQTLRNSSNVKLQLERGGRNISVDYKITQ